MLAALWSHARANPLNCMLLINNNTHTGSICFRRLILHQRNYLLILVSRKKTIAWEYKNIYKSKHWRDDRWEKPWFVANTCSRCVVTMCAIFNASRLVVYFICFFYVGIGSSWAHSKLLEILAAPMVAQLKLLKSRSTWQPNWLTGWCSSVQRSFFRLEQSFGCLNSLLFS